VVLMIYQGDCLDILPTLDAESVDSIVTDPPYGISFMGKKWDYDVPSVDVWRECLRVLKPGGHLLSFAGTRTQHRMACNIEDAGFEIRDMIFWTYASGFPKSLNIEKQLRKLHEKAISGEQEAEHVLRPMREADLQTEITNSEAEGEILQSGLSEQGISNQGMQLPPQIREGQSCVEGRGDLFSETRELQTNKVCEMSTGIHDDGEERRVYNGTPFIDGSKITTPFTSDGNNTPHQSQSTGQQNREPNAFPEQQIAQAIRTFKGFGTALKPSCEPITVARKPLEKGLTVAENCLKWGTGGINIDGCRVKTEELITNHSRGSESAVSKGKYGDSCEQETHQTRGQALGRFPANLIHDGSQEVLDLFPSPHGAGHKRGGGLSKDGGSMFCGNHEGNGTRLGDSGSAARFFYCAKASKHDRDEGCECLKAKKMGFSNGAQLHGEGYDKGQDIGLNRVISRKNNHPTVKPTALMRYLCRLVTPPGGTILDPFMGSGSTGKAAALEGFRFIGIELEKEYTAIAEKRIMSAQPLFAGLEL
jgi:DNA modification methylase